MTGLEDAPRRESHEFTAALTATATATESIEAWGQVMHLYRQMNTDWTHLCTRTSSRRHVRRWAELDTRFTGFTNPGQIIEHCQHTPSATANELLASLMAIGDDLALRTTLEAFLPLLYATGRRAARRGHCGPNSPWPNPGDIDVDLMAEAWRWLSANSGRPITWPAPRLARQLWRHVTRTSTRHRAHQQRLIPDAARQPSLNQLDQTQPLELTADPATSDEHCARRVIDAYQAGRLDQRRAQLLYGTVVLGDTIDTIARRHGHSAAALRQDKHRHRTAIAAAVVG